MKYNINIEQNYNRFNRAVEKPGDKDKENVSQ